MGRIVVVAGFFLLLAISAALDFPGNFFADPMPRGMRTLDWIITTFATSPFGKIGGAAMFILLGAVATALALKREYRPGGRATAIPDKLPVDAIPLRRRHLVPAGLAQAEASASGTKGQLATLLGASPGSAEAEDRRPAEEKDYARLLMQIVEDNQPPPPPEGPIDPIIDAARQRPIVFRRNIEATEHDSLSFYGGRPVAPASLVWPRVSADPASKPLHFIMQWDCRALAAQDATGLLPTDGVLYFFLDFEWGKDDGFRFVHCPGPIEGWQAIEPPADLGPVHGDQGAWQMAGCTSKVDDADDYVPRLMPHALFDPIAFDYPMPLAEERNNDEENERLFWHDDPRCREALLAVENGANDGNGEVRDINVPPKPFARPFDAFPHDFGAIRVLAAKAIKDLESPYMLGDRKWMLPDLSEQDRDATLATWLDQARELYLFAATQPLGTLVPPDTADQVWQWTEELKPIFRLGFDGLVVSSIELSLGYRSEALRAIPLEWIGEAARLHKLAHAYLCDERPADPKTDTLKRHEERRARGELAKVREVHGPTPTHMFGPPSYVQGYVEELVDDHLLLLELTSGSGPAHHFGDGVLQYLIRPEDLRSGRFENVKAVISGY